VECPDDLHTMHTIGKPRLGFISTLQVTYTLKIVAGFLREGKGYPPQTARVE
jgi:hypothetical protein